MEKTLIRTFPDLQALSRAAADFFVQLSSTSVSEKGRFSVALTGGSTPRPLYHLLTSPEFMERIDWSCVHLFWGDERCVPPEHPDSNYRMADDALLSQVPIHAENIYRMSGEMDPGQAAGVYEKELRNFFKGREIPKFDMILLGLGTDGHTASLFPDSPALKEKIRLVLSDTSPERKHPRLTLTLPVINHAANILFLVAGKEKARILAQVLDEKKEPDRIPAKAVRPRSGRLFWFVDEAAASDLKKPL